MADRPDTRPTRFDTCDHPAHLVHPSPFHAATAVCSNCGGDRNGDGPWRRPDALSAVLHANGQLARGPRLQTF